MLCTSPAQQRQLSRRGRISRRGRRCWLRVSMLRGCLGQGVLDAIRVSSNASAGIILMTYQNSGIVVGHCLYNNLGSEFRRGSDAETYIGYPRVSDACIFRSECRCSKDCDVSAEPKRSVIIPDRYQCSKWHSLQRLLSVRQLSHYSHVVVGADKRKVLRSDSPCKLQIDDIIFLETRLQLPHFAVFTGVTLPN